MIQTKAPGWALRLLDFFAAAFLPVTFLAAVFFAAVFLAAVFFFAMSWTVACSPSPPLSLAFCTDSWSAAMRSTTAPAGASGSAAWGSSLPPCLATIRSELASVYRSTAASSGMSSLAMTSMSARARSISSSGTSTAGGASVSEERISSGHRIECRTIALPRMRSRPRRSRPRHANRATAAFECSAPGPDAGACKAWQRPGRRARGSNPRRCGWGRFRCTARTPRSRSPSPWSGAGRRGPRPRWRRSCRPAPGPATPAARL